MKIVALSTCEFLGSYVIRRVHQEWPIDRVLRLRFQPPASSLKKKLRSLLSGKFLLSIEQRLFYRELFERQELTIEKQLKQTSNKSPFPPTVDIFSRQLNSPETAELLRELAPDILLVCSAPILKPEIFTIPKIATINIHFGWAPDYRGEHTLFWPIYRRDYSKLGVTVHRIDAGIDTGPLLAQGSVELSAHDNEATLLTKGTQLGAELVLEILAQAAIGPIPGLSQTACGKIFNYLDRRVWHDTWLFMRRRFFRERLPVLPERRFYMADGTRSHESPRGEQHATALSVNSDE